MASSWCPTCCTDHPDGAVCPGELPASEPERHGWRINVETPHGIQAHGVLVAESYGLWRARIVTYPNVLWIVPGGRGTIKFVGRTPQEAERKAADFILGHCRRRGYRVRDELTPVESGKIDAETGPPPLPRPAGQPSERKLRFLPLRFGVAGPTELGGTGNLSETGLFVITGAPVDSGRWLDLLLQLDGEQELPLKGVVRWMHRRHHAGRSPGMGIQLQAPPPLYLDYVRSLS